MSREGWQLQRGRSKIVSGGIRHWQVWYTLWLMSAVVCGGLYTRNAGSCWMLVDAGGDDEEAGASDMAKDFRLIQVRG